MSKLAAFTVLAVALCAMVQVEAQWGGWPYYGAYSYYGYPYYGYGYGGYGGYYGGYYGKREAGFPVPEPKPIESLPPPPHGTEKPAHFAHPTAEESTKTMEKQINGKKPSEQ